MNVRNKPGRPRKEGGTGANKHCSFGNCNSDRRSKHLQGCIFFPFPKPCLNVRKNFITANAKHLSSCESCKKCSTWIVKCKRNDDKFKSLKDVKKDTYICNKHFVKEDLLNHYPDPMPEDVVYKLNDRSRKRKLSPLNSTKPKVAKNGQLESNLETVNIIPDISHAKIVPQQTFVVTNVTENVDECQIEKANCTVEVTTEAVTEYLRENNVACETATPIIQEAVLYSKSSQTTFRLKDTQMLQNKISKLQKEILILKKAKIENTKIIDQFEKDIQENGTMCKFYTNLYFPQSLHLITFLNVPSNIHYWGETGTATKIVRKRKLTVQQQIIITLVRLRTGLLVKDLSYRFKLSEGLITKTIFTWIQYMYHQFDSIRHFMFPSRDKIKETLPKSFKTLKNIRVILDCAEFFCQSPNNFEQQGNLYSQYKALTTFKVLLGCTPNGAVSFVSDLFEGSISDKELVIQSKLMDLLEDEDLVLADRGFTIKDLTDTKNVALNIPPFLKGRDKLSPEEEIETKKIAKARVYVEHVVGRIKQFRLLQKTLPLNMRSVMSQVVFVCACLLNFQEPLVSDN